jgi:hypothetical protein
MRVIKNLSKQMCEEIDALEYRESDPELANVYHKLAEIEYGHAIELHKQAVRKVEEFKDIQKNVPDFMLDRWQEAHEKVIKKAEKAKLYLDLW